MPNNFCKLKDNSIRMNEYTEKFIKTVCNAHKQANLLEATKSMGLLLMEYNVSLTPYL